MDAAQALAELKELSSQVERAVILRGDGSILAATDDGVAAESLASAALELVAGAFDLRSSPEAVTRVEVELDHGAVFVLSEGGRTIAATTRPQPTAGLVVYDLRTCLHSIDEARPKRQRKPKDQEPEEQS